MSESDQVKWTRRRVLHLLGLTAGAGMATQIPAWGQVRQGAQSGNIAVGKLLSHTDNQDLYIKSRSLGRTVKAMCTESTLFSTHRQVPPSAFSTGDRLVVMGRWADEVLLADEVGVAFIAELATLLEATQSALRLESGLEVMIEHGTQLYDERGMIRHDTSYLARGDVLRVLYWQENNDRAVAARVWRAN